MELETKRFYKFLAPRTTAIITTVDKEKNVSAAPFSFIMPVSMNPPLLVVAMKEGDTLGDIRATRAFVVNIPSKKIMNEFWACSKKHPRNENELQEVGLTTVAPEKVLVPCIAECAIWFECLLKQEHKHGDHVLVVGEVVHVEVGNELVRKDGSINLAKANVLMHISGPKFTVAKREISVTD